LFYDIVLFYVKYCKNYLNLGFVLVFVAKMQYVLCTLASKSFIEFSVSITITTSMNHLYDIKFNPTYEANGLINFLYLLLIRKPYKIETDIFWKSTNTKTTINFFSNHSTEHRIAPYSYYVTRIQSLPTTPESKQKEWTVIQYNPWTNNFQHTLIQKLHSQLQHTHTTTTETITLSEI
jgi:hypothetical protein